jgi:hypothetical protein
MEKKSFVEIFWKLFRQLKLEGKARFPNVITNISQT